MCVMSWAQGTVNFSNYSSALGYEARMVDCDGVTRLAGPEWLLQLYAGPAGTPDHLLRPVGTAVEFKSGAAAGLFNGGMIMIPDVSPANPARVRVKIWEAAAGPRFESAIAACRKRYVGPVFEVARTGGAGVPPSMPTNLVGLQAFSPLCGCNCYDSCVPLRCRISREGDQVVVTWFTQSGLTYSLMRARAVDGGWETVLTETANGGTLSASIPIEEASCFFYVYWVE